MRTRSNLILIIPCILCIPTLAFAQKAPPQAEWDKASADITGTDTAAQTAALEKIKGWVKGGWVSADVFRKWLPALVKANRHQDAYDLATLALPLRPAGGNPDAGLALQEFRLRAMLALNKNDDALKLAKAYYNIVPMKSTAAAVDLLATALARAHPDDLEIVRKFRNEQAAASQGRPPDPPESGILKSVKIDDKPLADALPTWAAKTKFADRVSYGTLLLLCDKGDDAEKVFRELYQLAATADELTQATEGIARSLRAQDGNLARANAWLAQLSANAATQASPTTTTPPATHPTSLP